MFRKQFVSVAVSAVEVTQLNHPITADVGADFTVCGTLAPNGEVTGGETVIRGGGVNRDAN